MQIWSLVVLLLPCWVNAVITEPFAFLPDSPYMPDVEIGGSIKAGKSISITTSGFDMPVITTGARAEFSGMMKVGIWPPVRFNRFVLISDYKSLPSDQLNVEGLIPDMPKAVISKLTCKVFNGNGRYVFGVTTDKTFTL